MDGENSGKPYEQMDDLGGKKSPLFLETPTSIKLRDSFSNLGWLIGILMSWLIRKYIDSIRGLHFPASYVIVYQRVRNFWVRDSPFWSKDSPFQLGPADLVQNASLLGGGFSPCERNNQKYTQKPVTFGRNFGEFSTRTMLISEKNMGFLQKVLRWSFCSPIWAE